jgi:hypothetical protein
MRQCDKNGVNAGPFMTAHNLDSQRNETSSAINQHASTLIVANNNAVFQNRRTRIYWKENKHCYHDAAIPFCLPCAFAPHTWFSFILS